MQINITGYHPASSLLEAGAVRCRRFPRARRTRTGLCALVVALCSAGCGGAVQTGSAGDRPGGFGQTATVTVSSTPEQVIHAYIDALNRRSDEAMRQTTTEGRYKRLDEQQLGPFAGAPLTDVRLGIADAQYPIDAGGTEGDGYDDAVFIPASYISGEGGDRTMSGFLLVRDAGQPWRIADQGPV